MALRTPLPSRTSRKTCALLVGPTQWHAVGCYMYVEPAQVVAKLAGATACPYGGTLASLAHCPGMPHSACGCSSSTRWQTPAATQNRHPHWPRQQGSSLVLHTAWSTSPKPMCRFTEASAKQHGSWKQAAKVCARRCAYLPTGWGPNVWQPRRPQPLVQLTSLGTGRAVPTNPAIPRGRLPSTAVQLSSRHKGVGRL